MVAFGATSGAASVPVPMPRWFPPTSPSVSIVATESVRTS